MLARTRHTINTPVDNFAAMQIRQSVQDAFSYFSKYLLAGPTSKFLDLTVDAMETSSFTVLHSNRHCTAGVVHEGSVVLTDILRRAILVEG